MKKIMVLAILALLVTGCETMKGFGKDMKKLGGEIEKAADKAVK